MNINYIDPFLDNIGTVGTPTIKQTFEGNALVTFRNRKRGFMHSEGAAVNKRVYFQLQQYLTKSKPNDIPDESLDQLLTLRTRISECCKHSLFREFHEGDELQFIAAHTCDHKYCFVCNKLRSKTIRRKFAILLEQYPELKENYDFMHLTLTVKHDKNGWNGEKFYASKLIEKFNFMRKKKWWINQVYAGEFGVEITKNENGLHIHIHSLLLVHRERGNRNRLHREILLHWNKATAPDYDTAHNPLSPEIRAEIKKGNRTITDMDTALMTDTGATFIGLENLYTLHKEKVPGSKYCERSKAYKLYSDKAKDKDKALLAGVMECIKYHFEPSGMYMDEGRLDFDLLNEILPKIYRKPLYRKFGAFHSGTKNAHPGAKLLNFNDSVKETPEAVLAETGNEQVTHPSTGVPVEREEFSYFISRADKIYYDKSDGYRPFMSRNSKKVYLHNAHTVLDALFDMLLRSNPYIAINDEKRQFSQYKKKEGVRLSELLEIDKKRQSEKTAA